MVLLATLALGPFAQAAIVFTAEESEGDVILSFSGSISDLDNFIFDGVSLFPPGFVRSTSGIGAGTVPVVADIFAGPISGPSSIGIDSTAYISDSNSPTFFAFEFGTFGDSITLPENYVPGTWISGESTFNNTTIVGLGIDTSQSSY